MDSSVSEKLRALPSIDEVLAYPTALWMAARLPRERVVDLARNAVDSLRAGILAGRCDAVTQEAVETALVSAMRKLETPSLRRVVNATGVVLHTNLGRSPLAGAAIDAVVAAAAGYSTLEYSTETLERGSRHDHCEALICELTGAEAAIAVNNNAAAVMLVLAEFAAGHKAVVSRGELVEIGGSFRIPDIMAASNAHMVEVGATNKTHLYDYEQAIDEDVAMLLKVHPSNFRIHGFTEDVSIAQLRKLADAENERRAGAGTQLAQVLVYEDQGSGCFLRMDCFGELAEPTVADSVKQGVDLVSFSGDKLLGGPQAGIIVGRASLINRLKKNPLVRALRLDKMTLAALEATLRLYVAGPDEALQNIPVLRMLNEPADTVRVRAQELACAIAAQVPEGFLTCEVVDDESCAGGGSMPDCPIATAVVRVTFPDDRTLECERFLAQRAKVPVICRCRKGQLLFDARTLFDRDIDDIACALAAYKTSVEGSR